MANDEIRMTNSHLAPDWSFLFLFMHYQPASQLARIVKSALAWTFGTIALWTAWFYLWFNHGWFGATGIIVRWQNADGEGAYSAMDTEMLLISASLCLAIAAYHYRTSTLKSEMSSG